MSGNTASAMQMTRVRDEQALVANARMYSVNAEVAALWERLFHWIAAESDVALVVVAHAAPEPLEALWLRTDLGCAFMCGYPFATWREAATHRPRLLAAPLPSPARYEQRPAYCTDIVVHADSAYETIDALRRARFGYTTENSQSGCRAPRDFFAERARNADERSFSAVIGPLQTPRSVVNALLDGRIDAGPLDSWWHDLLQRHEPATASRLRVVASTPLAPIPPLVCSEGVSDAGRERLAAALMRVADDSRLADLRDGLLLRGFAVPDEKDYMMLAGELRRADEDANFTQWTWRG